MEPSQQPTNSNSSRPSSSALKWWVLVLVFLILILLVERSIVTRVHQKKEIVKNSQEVVIPSVLIVHPKLLKPEVTLRLPGNVKPYADIPIYARTDGYLKHWFVDIGGKVKSGALLAEIESPEIDQEYNQALGKLQQVEAQYKLAKVTAERWEQLRARKTVSPHEADQKQADFEVAQANMVAAKALVGRLQKLKDFGKIVAPFEGVITERNINIGDLINTNNSKQPLFELIDDKILRIYVHIPESSAHQIHLGEIVRLELSSQPGKFIKGKLVHTTDKIDSESRTLLVEIQVPNTDRQLLTGGYATVFLPITVDHPAVLISVNTLLFRPEGAVVGLVDNKGYVELKKIRIGKDFGNQVEVISGLQPTDNVILNPSDSLRSGDHVSIVQKKN